MQLKKYLRLLGFSVLSVAFLSWTINKIETINKPEVETDNKVLNEADNEASTLELVYDSLELDEQGLSHDAFTYAMNGFKKLDEEGVLQNDSVLTIIDFDQPSSQKRMYIIDVKNYKMLFNTWVAHGRNTGKEMAEFFSNTNESHKSSLGFYITDQTYSGSKGYSLKLKGLEQNLNTNAMRRAIVIHGAPYVSQSFIDAQGYIGRSHGCPAIPTALTKPIIQTIKNGSCLFIYNRSYKPSPHFSVG
ncbi:murein L,D-transpeptidase catalytic domain family protein [Niabella hibiscisoli]|uniref:murein L,D-transpeptidase catalytic domain family protein n=1 Tax=Niabella hibiscisoli TaxID=1825928 RepID=UPI001F0CE8C8|nr:murein L,D-transpeptidase catalytic domain family protein [Niabella hibiscisoli]MCH5720612.1 murein L,D-transpeptidase catalytic domain family protein [Niabella hibiscisoli]